MLDGVLLTVTVAAVDDDETVVAEVETLVVVVVVAFPSWRFANGLAGTAGIYRSNNSRISLEPELNSEESEGWSGAATTAGSTAAL